MGLIHFVALDLNLYYGVDPCGDPCITRVDHPG